MLNTLVFFFVYCTPVVYHGDFASGRGWIATFLVTFCAYGLLEIGVKLENPFGFDDVDHDLEDFGRKMSKESDMIAKITAKEYSAKNSFLQEVRECSGEASIERSKYRRERNDQEPKGTQESETRPCYYSALMLRLEAH
jgi:hypothetical protein